jgi:hypothetical protein
MPVRKPRVVGAKVSFAHVELNSIPLCRVLFAAANVDVIAALSSIGDAVKAMGLSISRLEGRTSDIVAISTTVKRLEGQISEIIPIVPVVLKLSAVQNNFWTPSVLSSGRSSRFRRKLTKSVGDTTTAGAVCMVSGHVGTGDQVRAAHIVPCSSDASKLAFIGLTIDDVNSPRNGLFLAKNVEMAFDKLQLSFIKTKLFYDRLYLKIWDDSCRSVPIWPGHATTIGDLDGRELVLGAHKPFKRALSFQSYQAYMHCTTVGKVMPEPYGTPEAQCDARVQADAWYKAEQLRDIADQHFKNMQEELDDEASDAEEVG